MIRLSILYFGLLKFTTHRYGRAKPVEFPRYRRVFTVDRAELALEICDGASQSHAHKAQKDAARTFLCDLGIVGPLTEAPHILGEADARLELQPQDVAFVQEEHQVDLCEQLIRANLFP